jgi:hypothetical protein
LGYETEGRSVGGRSEGVWPDVQGESEGCGADDLAPVTSISLIDDEPQQDLTPNEFDTPERPSDTGGTLLADVEPDTEPADPPGDPPPGLYHLARDDAQESTRVGTRTQAAPSPADPPPPLFSPTSKIEAPQASPKERTRKYRSQPEYVRSEDGEVLSVVR